VGVFNDGNIPSLFAHSFSVMKTAQGFARAGCRTEVVTPDSLRARWRRRRHPDLAAHYGLEAPVAVRWLMPSVRAWLSGNTGDDLSFSLRAAHRARERGLDLVYARNYLTPRLTAKLGIPTVMETHTVSYDHPELRRIYEVAGLEAFRGLITIHPDIAREHVRRGLPESKVLVLEDGVDVERFLPQAEPAEWRRRLGLEPGRRHAVYSGHLYADKGIEVILAVAEKLKGREDLLFLLVGGFARDRRHWQAEARRRGLGNLSFTGFLPNAQVPGYLAAADCLLLPYQPERRHTVMDIHTTSPLKLFEYMAAGRPIVATDIPTVAKVVTHEHSGLLAPPGDAEAFAAAVERCLDQPGMARRLGEAARQEVQAYSWTRRCRRILEHAGA
jgi:glycosyltransferase involved in cell wall biosynthesis